MWPPRQGLHDLVVLTVRQQRVAQLDDIRLALQLPLWTARMLSSVEESREVRVAGAIRKNPEELRRTTERPRYPGHNLIAFDLGDQLPYM